ncbi:MAG: hypothetical protein LBG58_07255 [Planctomycetaceae bacterium]|nr:hypothetical protein [Planctomycetaceae bacterium]
MSRNRMSFTVYMEQRKLSIGIFLLKNFCNYSVEEGCAGWFVIVLYAVGL